jgi:hypothetical protein
MPECFDAVGDDGLDSVQVTHVAIVSHDATAGLLHQVDGFVEVLGRRHRRGDAVDLFAQIERDDVGAFLCEAHRMRAPLAARRAGDERDLPFELS